MVDHDWTPARNEQAIGRLLRNGQERPVVVHHIYAENTIDQDVAESCYRKEKIIEETLA
jgi:SNF2 family DNA or RNA helicase